MRFTKKTSMRRNKLASKNSSQRWRLSKSSKIVKEKFKRLGTNKPLKIPSESMKKQLLRRKRYSLNSEKQRLR